MSDKVVVAELPKCDFCPAEAAYDGKTTMGPWASMCGICFGAHGVGLGTGKGQRLLTQEQWDAEAPESNEEPSIEELEDMMMDGVCVLSDGRRVELDHPDSPLRKLGII